MVGRVQLQLEALKPASKPRPALAVAPTPAAAAGEAKLPDVFDLQFKLTNGDHLRGSFPPEATLQQVCHYLDTQRTGGHL